MDPEKRLWRGCDLPTVQLVLKSHPVNKLFYLGIFRNSLIRKHAQEQFSTCSASARDDRPDAVSKYMAMYVDVCAATPLDYICAFYRMHE